MWINTKGVSTVTNSGTCGILLANVGSPAEPTPRAVRKYLTEFLSDKRIVPMNRFAWWFMLRTSILPKRSRISAAKYQEVWEAEGSPLLVAHEKIAKGLEAALRNEGFDNVVVVNGMSFGEPSLATGLAALEEAGCQNVLVLPLYPQSAYSTTGSVYDRVESAMHKLKWDVPCHLIDNYHDHATYTGAIAASLKHAGFDPERNDKVLFSFHSIPHKDIEAGDTYELQCGASSLQIANNLGIDRKQWTIGYQSRFDNNRDWLSPFTTEVIDRWAEADIDRIFFVCPGFSVDCLETLYDIEHELKPYYLQARMDFGRPSAPLQFVYVPCLDRTKAHIKVLQKVLHPYLEEL